MREIGSEFYLPPKQSSAICFVKGMQETRWFISGRTALDHIIQDIILRYGHFSVYMPAYCCESMILPFLRHGTKIQYYTIEFGEYGVFSTLDSDHGCDAVLIIDYFGFRDKSLSAFAQSERVKGRIVIYDATMSMFCSGDHPPADYTFGSCRKWMMCFAAYATSRDSFRCSPPNRNNLEYIKKRTEASQYKSQYLSSPKPPYDKEVYLGLYREAEIMLASDYVGFRATDKAVLEVLHCDTEQIVRVRRENAERLIEGLNTFPKEIIQYSPQLVSDEDCPLFVPIAVRPDIREGLRKHLISTAIYCPVHWPLSAYHSIDEKQQAIYFSTLSLVCDQRYNTDDMDRILEEIVNYLQSAV